MAHVNCCARLRRVRALSIADGPTRSDLKIRGIQRSVQRPGIASFSQCMGSHRRYHAYSFLVLREVTALPVVLRLLKPKTLVALAVHVCVWYEHF